jgi:IclR family KDG regulon transcriptional repressor
VRSAIAILRYLHDQDNEPVTMSQLARALRINGSTCFNILKTLESERLLSYDPVTRTYELGLELVELASVVDNHGQVVQVAMKHAAELVDEIELACLLVRFTSNEEFLVVEKVESPKPIKVTVALGERFPANSAVLAKGYYAWQDEAVVDDMLRRHGLPAYAPNSITDVGEFKQALTQVRRQGFAESRAEYWQDHNALSSPIFGRHGEVSHLLVTVGFAFELPPETMQVYGRRQRETAERITRQIGGRYPEGLGDPPAPESRRTKKGMNHE